ncbi:hypothetical protein PUG81_18065 [Erwiniaceae bacterium L1_54_6]|nr:hypothetical protein [Erwiniaceae bacterium L1_54_6]
MTNITAQQQALEAEGFMVTRTGQRLLTDADALQKVKADFARP